MTEEGKRSKGGERTEKKGQGVGMGVFIRRTRTGIYPNWIGFWQEDGKRHETSLCRWEGMPPGPGEKEGDRAFEASRRRAEEMFARLREGGKSKEEETALVKKVLAVRYRRKVDRVRLGELAERWEELPMGEVSAERRRRVRQVVGRFVEFMARRVPRVTETGELEPRHFKEWLDEVDGEGLSARSWNDHLSILRSVVGKVDGQSRGYREWLAVVPKRKESPVHRRPFSAAELEAVFEAAKVADAELYPVIVAAAFTGLRRGDVARLTWESVDLAGGFVTVERTGKTGEPAEIPVMGRLGEVLREAWKRRKRGEEHVFPGIAESYERNPDGLDWRLQKVMAAAGFSRESGLAAKGGAQRKNRGSLRGWHCFRTSLCSLALEAGVPMDILRRVTGHTTASIVDKHYNMAKREQTRRAFASASPLGAGGGVMVEFPAERAEVARELATCGGEAWGRVQKALRR